MADGRVLKQILPVVRQGGGGHKLALGVVKLHFGSGHQGSVVAYGVAVFLQNKTSASVGSWAKDGTQMFLVSGDISNKALAILLTAFSMNKTVYVQVASPATPGSIISGVYVNK